MMTSHYSLLLVVLIGLFAGISCDAEAAASNTNNGIKGAANKTPTQSNFVDKNNDAGKMRQGNANSTAQVDNAVVSAVAAVPTQTQEKSKDLEEAVAATTAVPAKKSEWSNQVHSDFPVEKVEEHMESTNDVAPAIKNVTFEHLIKIEAIKPARSEDEDEEPTMKLGNETQEKNDTKIKADENIAVKSVQALDDVVEKHHKNKPLKKTGKKHLKGGKKHPNKHHAKKMEKKHGKHPKQIGKTHMKKANKEHLKHQGKHGKHIKNEKAKQANKNKKNKKQKNYVQKKNHQKKKDHPHHHQKKNHQGKHHPAKKHGGKDHENKKKHAHKHANKKHAHEHKHGDKKHVHEHKHADKKHEHEHVVETHEHEDAHDHEHEEERPLKYDVPVQEHQTKKKLYDLMHQTILKKIESDVVKTVDSELANKTVLTDDVPSSGAEEAVATVQEHANITADEFKPHYKGGPFPKDATHSHSILHTRLTPDNSHNMGMVADECRILAVKCHIVSIVCFFMVSMVVILGLAVYLRTMRRRKNRYLMYGEMDPENCEVNQVLYNQCADGNGGLDSHMLKTRHTQAHAQNKRRFLLDDPQ